MFIDTEIANRNSKKPDVIIEPSSHPRYSEDTTPLLDSFLGQEAPPPSYLEATTPNPWNVRPSGDEEARLLAYDGRPSPGVHSADPLDGMYNGMYKGPSYRRRSLREKCTGRRMLKWIAALLAIVILAAIIAAVTHHQNTNTVASPVTETPLAAETGLPDGFIGKPTPSSRPPKFVDSETQDNYPIRWPARCGKDYNTKTHEFDFGAPSELLLKEAVHQLEGGYKRISGWIHIVKAPEDQTEGTIRAKLAYAASTSVDINTIPWAVSANSLVIGDPETTDVFDGVHKGTACLGISVVVYMAAGVTLENLNASSTHLGMQIHDGVNFSVTNRTSISLVTGTLDAAQLDSRETRLDTISGSISGKYALADLLSVNTKSGSVNINVEPQEKKEGGKDAAIFEATSISGSLRTDFERKRIPDRDYQVTIDTKMGSIDGAYIHGSSTLITSVAGSITADILPFHGRSYTSRLETESSSGQTILKLHAPYNKSGPLDILTSVHKSISGALELTYPQEWTGHLDGSTINGLLHLQGRDLELIHQGEDLPGGRTVEAKKGTGKSNLSFSTISGGCDVKVGRL
ncbi:hypothetical protein P154DRAFT_526879 [Amniculicola lignicola CBS 123094]|uniref:Adhesin domain-containing protein n=1 Tax=Amniculicola lignicola CBS 123094 TaxID=1392246 RepID=A0A6A5W1C9_9PLEO|nr:hypothetical protein P154DRAFT_526879 [Amniculicola lignicola CBS 123094]